MRLPVIVLGILVAASPSIASAVQLGRAYTPARPSAIDPRQVGIESANASPRSKADAARARCLKRKVKERRACLAQADEIAASNQSK